MIRRPAPPVVVAAAVAAAVLPLSGCAADRDATARAVRDALEPLPDRFASSAADGDADRSSDDGTRGRPWWTSFEDVRLDGLVREALANNRDLRATAARVEAAFASAAEAGGARLPRVDAGFDATRTRQNVIGIVPGVPLLTNYATSYGLSLSVSWELDLWGRLAAGANAADARAAATSWDLEGALQSIAASTAKAWFGAIEAEQQLDLAERARENRETARVAIRTAFDAGRATSLDLELARTEVANAEAEVVAATANRNAARRALERLLGRYPDASLRAALDLPAPPAPIPPGLPAALLDRRPDLRAARARLEASGFDTHAARADLYPRLALTASGGTRSNDLSDLLDGDFRVWSIAGSVLQPVFNGGALRARVRASEAREREAAESFAARVLDACAEVEGLLELDHLLAERERALVAAETSADEAERGAMARYRSGQLDIATLLLAQRSALAARSARVAVRRARLETRVDLHLALGGTLADARRLDPDAATSTPTTPSDALDDGAPVANDAR